MTKMSDSSIMHQVTNFIDHDVSLRRALTRGFVNTRALAKYIQNHLEISTNIDAVISAIRRYDIKEDFKKTTKQRYKIIANAKVSSRTKLCCLVLKKEKEVKNALTKLYSQIDFSKGEILRTLECNQYVSIVIDESNISNAKRLFSKDHIITVTNKLGEITILYEENISSVPGIFAALSSEIALHNIAIRNALLSETEHIIIISEQDLILAMQVIHNIRTWSENKKKHSY